MSFFDKVTKFFSSTPVRFVAGAAGAASGLGMFDDVGPMFGSESNFLKPQTLIGAANLASGASAQARGKGSTALNFAQMGLGGYNVAQGFDKIGTFQNTFGQIRDSLFPGEVASPTEEVRLGGGMQFAAADGGLPTEGGVGARTTITSPVSTVGAPPPEIADPSVSYSVGGGGKFDGQIKFDDDDLLRRSAPPAFGTTAAAGIKEGPRFGAVTSLGDVSRLPASVGGIPDFPIERIMPLPEAGAPAVAGNPALQPTGGIPDFPMERIGDLPAARAPAAPLDQGLVGVTIPIAPAAVVGPENSKLPPGAALRGLEDAPLLYPGPDLGGMTPTSTGGAPLTEEQVSTLSTAQAEQNALYSGGYNLGGAARLDAPVNAAAMTPTSAAVPDPSSVPKMTNTKGVVSWFERQVEKDPLKVMLAGTMLTNLFRTDPAEKAAKEYADRMARYEQQLDPGTPFAQSYKESFRQARQDQLDEARKKAVDDYRAVMTARGMTDSSVFNNGIAAIESSYATEAARIPQDAENAFLQYSQGRFGAINAASAAAARPAALTAARGSPVNFAQSSYLLGGGGGR